MEDASLVPPLGLLLHGGRAAQRSTESRPNFPHPTPPFMSNSPRGLASIGEESLRTFSRSWRIVAVMLLATHECAFVRSKLAAGQVQGQGLDKATLEMRGARLSVDVWLGVLMAASLGRVVELMSRGHATCGCRGCL